MSRKGYLSKGRHKHPTEAARFTILSEAENTQVLTLVANLELRGIARLLFALRHIQQKR